MAFLVGNQEYSLLRLRALHLIVLNDELFLKDFDGVKLLRSLCFCQHNLTKITFPEHSKEIEVLKPNAPSHTLLRGGFACGLRFDDLLALLQCSSWLLIAGLLLLGLSDRGRRRLQRVTAIACIIFRIIGGLWRLL